MPLILRQGWHLHVRTFDHRIGPPTTTEHAAMRDYKI